MNEITQLLTNWLGSDNIHFNETAAFNQPVLLATYILNFLPMDSCGVCYRDNFRKKCRECVFVLCRECAGRLRNELCPHCQRENMFPGFIIPASSNFTRRWRRRRRNAVLFNNWTDNPFGPILLDVPPPPTPTPAPTPKEDNIRKLPKVAIDSYANMRLFDKLHWMFLLQCTS